MDIKVVRFLHSYRGYMAGETAGFPLKEAKHLIDSKLAFEYVADVPQPPNSPAVESWEPPKAPRYEDLPSELLEEPSLPPRPVKKRRRRKKKAEG